MAAHPVGSLVHLAETASEFEPILSISE
jgi:hypothetical protein